MKVVIVAKTHMRGGACIGAISVDGESVRLIAPDMESNEQFNLEYQIGDVWEIEGEPPAELKPPHIENLVVRYKRCLQAVSLDRVTRFIERVMPPASGGPDLLYDGLIQVRPGGAMYVTKRTGIPARSTLFWRPDRDLLRDDEGKRTHYRYPTHDGGRTLTFVGFQEPVGVIPAGTLVRVSLAHWWRPEDRDDVELRCYLQLSGWFEDGETRVEHRNPSLPKPASPNSPKAGPSGAAPSFADARGLLKAIFGFDDFLPLQGEVIANVLAGRDTLAIMPTGGGKSLCYQLPALLQDGVTVVISPLISLMQDQVDSLRELGVPAAFLNSTLDYHTYVNTKLAVRKGAVKLIYMAPETLLRPEILVLLDQSHVACITIDEAHCISSWGHDFRPEYRQLLPIRERYPDAVCLALTATATRRVQDDISKILGFGVSNRFVASFNRPNLYLEVCHRSQGIGQILAFLERHKGQSGIIYCQKRRDVDTLTNQLTQAGWNALPYHAGMDDTTRREHQQRFSRDETPIIVATIAFGMGINKSNVRFILHTALPENLESYYQEIGRAGRDGLRADCLLLWRMHDLSTIRHFIRTSADAERAAKEKRLQAMLHFARTTGCRRVPLLDYFGEKSPTKQCSMCDSCMPSAGNNDSGNTERFASPLRSTEPVAHEPGLMPKKQSRNEAPDQRASNNEHLLFEELRKVRYALAKTSNVPPYVIFSDRTLWDMVSRLPDSPEALLAVTGVGEGKLAKYGEQFLDAIRSFRAQYEVHEQPTATKKKRAPKPSAGSRRRTIGAQFAAGMSISELQRLYGIKEQTVIQHLYEYAMEGGTIDGDRVLQASRLSEEERARVLALFREIGTKYLRPIHDATDGTFTYDDLHLLRLYFMTMRSV